MGRQRGQQVRVPSVQESDIDNESVTLVQPPRRHSNRPGAGAGGRNSQLEKIGNAIQAPARAAGKSKVQNIVPFDEPENAMAPVAKKKRGGKVPRDRNLSAIVSTRLVDVHFCNCTITAVPSILDYLSTNVWHLAGGI